jgi:hypothetical protein
MECPRCQGFMVREWLSDILHVSYSWKCVNCGAIMDAVILENRRGGSPQLVGSRTELAR